MWKDIFYKGFFFEIKVYDEPSQYGINGGKISKLTARSTDHTTLANYDRGWDIEPDNKIMEAYNGILEMYN